MSAEPSLLKAGGMALLSLATGVGTGLGIIWFNGADRVTTGTGIIVGCFLLWLGIVRLGNKLEAVAEQFKRIADAAERGGRKP